MLIDTHAHLDFTDFDVDRDAVVQRALTNGVTQIITIGTNLEDSRTALQLAEKYPNVYAAVGIHPNDATETPNDFCETLRKLAKHPRVVAIGECGLDYHRLPSPEKKSPFTDLAKMSIAGDPEELELQMTYDEIKNKQAIVFQQQLDLAVELELNVIIHQRDSWDDTMKMLNDYHGKLRGVFHCFGGAFEDARELLANNHLVSFTGIVTFKNAKQVQETAQKLPDGAFMLETDCPFLAPTPYRGQRCEPSYTTLIAEKIAELRGTKLAEIAQMTTSTAHSFFRFPKN